jgi:NTP pyrophosphatase (non-canonical NTP hydrolase)
VDIADLQDVIARTYGDRDRQRGTPATVAWLCEELGELAQATRKGTPEQQLHELGDVLAWLASLAHQLGLSLDEAVQRYAGGCPALRPDPLWLPLRNQPPAVGQRSAATSSAS